MRPIFRETVDALLIGPMRRIIDAFDPSAFIVQHPLADVRGGVLPRHALPWRPST